MEFRTTVSIPEPPFTIAPADEILLVGSCFATAIGQLFQENMFRATVNPFGVMYNPASILHSVEKYEGRPRVVFLTLGTNHVYRLRETGEIVDNCQKRPAALFQEEELTVSECADYLRRAVSVLRSRRSDTHIVLTVSPIRYRKYGYHESQLSKATLLLATRELMAAQTPAGDAATATLSYFPAYEIVNDELRDYRFYAPDMLHPSQQAVDYIWERLTEHYLSDTAKQFLAEWQPLKRALAHRPLDPRSDDYRAFHEKTMLQAGELLRKYHLGSPQTEGL